MPGGARVTGVLFAAAAFPSAAACSSSERMLAYGFDGDGGGAWEGEGDLRAEAEKHHDGDAARPADVRCGGRRVQPGSGTAGGASASSTRAHAAHGGAAQLGVHVHLQVGFSRPHHWRRAAG